MRRCLRLVALLCVAGATRRAGDDHGRHARALSVRLRPAAREHRRGTVPAGDYAVQAVDGSLLGAVERKSVDDLAASLLDGTLAFRLQRLAELPLSAVVVEARYSALFKLEYVDGGWLADQLTRLQVRYPDVQLIFADSRRYAEDWTYRFLTTALADATEPTSNG
ncbi:MAG: hypothetical protein E6G08_08150 [Actinobacteria bacterium]|nr:MAG: hypothetical protein E6G08_08150 [Actinomycetota bacterium]